MICDSGTRYNDSVLQIFEAKALEFSRLYDAKSSGVSEPTASRGKVSDHRSDRVWLEFDTRLRFDPFFVW